MAELPKQKRRFSRFYWRWGKMKELILTIIFILLLLTAIASAYAQDAWYEVAEASGIQVV